MEIDFNLIQLRVRFFKKIQDWILKSERIRQWIWRFFIFPQSSPVLCEFLCFTLIDLSLLSLHHDPRELQLICLLNKRKIRFRILLVMSKTRVAPLRKITLPRLELMAAVITARLCTYVKGVIDCPINRIVCWTDNSLTLHWIRGAASQWKPFVANRVTEIQSLLDPSVQLEVLSRPRLFKGWITLSTG